MAQTSSAEQTTQNQEAKAFTAYSLVSPTPYDFKRLVQQKGIASWIVDRCDRCRYVKGFVFIGSRVFFDVGCHCNQQSGGSLEEKRWEDVAAFYRLQADQPMSAVWGFSDS